MSLKKILLARTDHLGDMLLCLPALECLHKAYPDAELHFVVTEAFVAIFRQLPWLTRVWTIAEIQAELPKLSFDAYVGFWEEEPLTSNAWVRKIPIRSGFLRHRRTRWLINRGVRQTHPVAAQRPQVLQNVDLLVPLGVSPSLYQIPMAGLKFLNRAGSESVQRIGFALDTAGSDRPYGEQAMQHLLQLSLQQWPQAQLVLLGTSRAEALAQKILSACGTEINRIENWVGKTDAAGLLAQVARLSLLVVANTGTAHLAAALDVPQLSLFLAQAPSLTRWAPWSLVAAVHKRPPSCEIICRPPSCPQASTVCERDLDPKLVLTWMQQALVGQQFSKSIADYQLELLKQGLGIVCSELALCQRLDAAGWRVLLRPALTGAQLRLWLRRNHMLVYVESKGSSRTRRWLERTIQSNYTGLMPLYYAYAGLFDVADFQRALFGFVGLTAETQRTLSNKLNLCVLCVSAVGCIL